MIWAGSSQTSSASSNATWCLRRLAAALSSSHSNITKLPVLTLSCIHCSRARCNAEPCGHNKPRFDAKRSEERDRPTGRPSIYHLHVNKPIDEIGRAPCRERVYQYV